MAQIFVGDRVRTPDGEGFAEDFVSWRTRIEGMHDYEAREFSEQCRMQCGPEFRERWGRVLVRVGARARWYDLAKVTVVEGRDGIVQR